jgi:xanthosine utilization system XapX-like protein
MSILTISKDELLGRLKSLLWRIVMMALSILVAFVLENLNVLNLPPSVIALLGLIFGEISKQINKNLKGIKALAGANKK